MKTSLSFAALFVVMVLVGCGTTNQSASSISTGDRMAAKPADSTLAEGEHQDLSQVGNSYHRPGAR